MLARIPQGLCGPMARDRSQYLPRVSLAGTKENRRGVRCFAKISVDRAEQGIGIGPGLVVTPLEKGQTWMDEKKTVLRVADFPTLRSLFRLFC